MYLATRIHIAEAKRGRRKGWVKPNPKYRRRILLADGTYKYVYADHDPKPLPVTKKDDWMSAAATMLKATVIRDINLNRRAATAIAVDGRGVVVVGADNLLGRKYVENKSRGTAYKGVILGYKTDGGNYVPDVYVYPVERIEDRLALEAQLYENLPQRLAKVHAWADSVITKRSAEDRQVALAVMLLHTSKLRIGGSGGSSVPKEDVVELQRRRKELGWSIAEYRDQLEKKRVSTQGVLDLEPRHVTITNNDDTYEVSISLLAKTAKEHGVVVPLDGHSELDMAYLKELRSRMKDKKIFSIGTKQVDAVYSTLADTTPHKERHSFARQQFVMQVLNGWKLTRRFKTKTAARKALKEVFYQRISVPLGHANAAHNITTALNSYIGLDMKLAYEGLLGEIDKLYARKSKKVTEADTTHKDFVEALASLIKLAAAKRELPRDAERVVFV